MKYLENTKEYVKEMFEAQSFETILLVTFLVFVITYRWGINRWICLQWPKLKKVKFLYCSSCFGWWVALAFSQNVITAALAFLIYNFYEKNRSY